MNYKKLKEKLYIWYIFNYLPWFKGLPAISTLYDWGYNVRNFIRPNHPRFRKAYKRHEYKDMDVLLPDCIFAALLDFWYGEVCPESIADWGEGWENREYDENQLAFGEKEINKAHYEIYKWMEKTVKDIEEKLPQMEEAWINEKNCDENERLEKEFLDEETRIMKEIIDKRSCLWT